MNKSTDILIIGGGLIGATLLLALKNLGYSALLVESKSTIKPEADLFDARSLALSPSSQRILNTLGLWDALKPQASFIEHIHVSNLGYFGASRLHAKEGEPLGYVLEMHFLNQVLFQALNPELLLMGASLNALEGHTAFISTESSDYKIQAKLIIAADGAQSLLRRLCQLSADVTLYQQEALVANVSFDKPHQGWAFERFTDEGPLALLPMQDNRMSLVWALNPNRARQLMVDEEALQKSLQKTFGYRLGRLTKIGQKSLFPLKQVLMPEQAKWPVVFVGNAAHSLHPVAGQGFNLGLRDVASLAECIAKQGLNESMLTRYLQLRQADQQVITRLTDALISVFTSQLPGMGLLRNLGLIAFDNLPVLKPLLMRYTQGFGGVIPDLVCGLNLRSLDET